uniref:Uncharacterized protein n=1 Tax=Meloidogyne enterolobii TaxID=390850 RepID=A0A6V7VHP4_MELEN|nr:unnamed protein product [Meloidogyne enterolobii]
MFKSSLLFVTFLFTILLLSNKFSEISAKPKPSDIGICTGKCNNIDRGDICCLVSIYPLEKETTCCKKDVGCNINGGCNPERPPENKF